MATSTWYPQTEANEPTDPHANTWRSETGIPKFAAPHARRRSLRVGVNLTIFLTACGLLVWFLLWLKPPRPAALVLVGASYDDSLVVPSNVYGKESLNSLVKLIQPASGGAPGIPVRLRQAPIDLFADTPWEQAVTNVPEKTLILFMALHGGGDRHGAYLLPQDADIGSNPKNRLRVAQILEQLKKLPRDKYKLLILDATQLTECWPLGMLHNDFARRLQDLEPEIAAVPNLIVISASGPDQRSWVSPDWRQTIFSHYLIEGLKGAADLDNNGRVDSLELFQYVRDQVAQWSLRNRHALQTPVMLPTGTTGESRARALDLGPKLHTFTPANPSDTPTFQAPEELLASWKREGELAQEAPLPPTYTAHAWKQYGTVLDSYSQMLRIRDLESAGARVIRLQELERRLQQARRLELSSMQNTLTMPAVAGIVPATPKQLGLAVESLWNAPDTERQPLWLKLQNEQADLSARQVFRLQICRQFIERAAQDPVKNLQKAHDLLQVVRDPLLPQPAEVHFLAMVLRDLPVKPPSPELAEFIQAALRVRLQAEQTALAIHEPRYSYSESLAPWIRPKVDAGDRQRRQGEDLLFASDPDRWIEGRGYLVAAQKEYQMAQEAIHSLGTALSMRDQALARLPVYTRWLGQRTPLDDADWQKSDTALVNQVVQAWQATHALTELFEGPDAAPSSSKPRDAYLLSIRAQAEQIRQQLTEVETAFSQEAQRLADPNAAPDWTDDAILTVPWLDPELRLRILTQLRKQSRRLLIDTAQLRDTPQAIAPERNEMQGKIHARRQGRLALAMVGKQAFDSLRDGDMEPYDFVAHRLKVFDTEEHWWKSIDTCGEELVRRWEKMPAAIQELLSKPQQRGKGGNLVQAANLACQVPAGVPLPEEPQGILRRLRVQDLLLWQAERDLADHWEAEQAGKEPYFRQAGAKYLRDIEQLKYRDWPAPSTKELREGLARDHQLKIDGTATLLWTSERFLRAGYQFAPAPNSELIPGFPVFWAETGPNLQLEWPEAGYRQARPIAKTAVEAFTCKLSSPLLVRAESESPRLAQKERARLTVVGLHRGKRFTFETAVDLYPLAEAMTVRYPLPITGNITVRASQPVQQRFGLGTGTIALLLDCSGSMGEPPGVEFTAKTKFNQATRAVKDVLQKLPRGSTVSIWVFGQAIGADKTVPEAEKTIQRVVKPTPWNPDDPALLNSVMERISYPRMTPWNESPIIRAMISAKEDLVDAQGVKSLIVITDGMDNRFDKDPYFKGLKKDIKTTLRDAFQDTGIAVNVVGFKVVDQEMKQAMAQFKVLEELTIPGKFYLVSEANELGDVLERLMHQRVRYKITRVDGTRVPEMPVGGLLVSSTAVNDQWLKDGLDAGGYVVSVHGNRRMERNVYLRRGELMRLNFVATQSGMAFERASLSVDDFPDKPNLEKSGRRLAVLANQWQPAQRGLRMLTTLETIPKADADLLDSVRPPLVWFEVKPSVPTKVPYSQRWIMRYGMVSPAWSLEVPEWATALETGSPLRPVVRGWWSNDAESTAGTTWQRGTDFKRLSDLSGKTITLAQGPVVCESVTSEEHVVEIRPGVREKRNCAVLRFQHSSRNPIWLHIPDNPLVGQEHRLYSEAGRYAALLWSVDPNDAAQSPPRVTLIALDAFKKEALQRGTLMELPLGLPQANDTPPQPPVELK